MAKLLLSAMRDECPFVLEWVTYHRAIGFDLIVVFSNDCTDGTDILLDGLAELGLVDHIRHSPDPARPIVDQIAEITAARGLLQDQDWAIWLDADEFLNIHVGEGRVDDLIEQLGEAQGICLGWRVFGDSGTSVFRGHHLSADFTQAAAPGDGWDNVKTLFRVDDGFDRLFNHKPIMTPDFWDGGGVFLNGAGQPLGTGGRLAKAWRKGQGRGKIDAEDASWDLAQINHYAVRTPALFAKKAARGRIGQANATGKNRYGEAYFTGLNKNDAEDRSILRWEAETRRHMDLTQARLAPTLDLRGLLAEHYDATEVAVRPTKTPSQGAADMEDTDRYQKMHQSHHDQREEREYSNARVAAEIDTLFAPKAVADIGCGVGLLLQKLSTHGAVVTGVEGEWLRSEDTLCPEAEFIRTNLEHPFDLNRRFDVVSSIEVAEHLEPERADGFVADLCKHSDVVVFAAAIPGQGGKGHKNEQWQSYWAKKFEAAGYLCFDPIRPKLARDAKVLAWHRQNILVYAKDGSDAARALAGDQIPTELADHILPTYHNKVVKRTRRALRKKIDDLRAKQG